MKKPRYRLRSKLLLAFVATLMALGLSEGVLRLTEQRGPSAGTIYAPGGRRVPLAEVVNYATLLQSKEEVNRELAGPHGLQQRNVVARMGYENPLPRWDYFDEHGCVSINSNSLGFRDEEFTVEKQPGEFRALAFGDSFTWGQGVRLDLTWPQVLERRLQQQRKAPVQVINCGFACGPGVHSPDGYDGWLQEHGVHFAPDLVIVGMCLNDMGKQVPMLSYPIIPLEPIWGGWSAILDHAVRAWRQRKVMAEPRDLTWLVEKHPSFWDGTKRGLLAMRDLLRDRNIPLVVAVFPMFSEMDRYPYAGLHAMLGEFLRESGIDFLDLKPAFEGCNEQDMWVHVTDQHPNHKAMAIFAEHIHAHLRERNLVPR